MSATRRRSYTLVPGVAMAMGASQPIDQMADLTELIVEQRTRALTAALVELLPTAVWLVDLHGQLEIANAAARRTAPGLVAVDASGIVFAIGGRSLAELVAAGEPQAWEARSPDGTSVYEVRAHLAVIEGNRRLSVVATDVTRERAILARLADAERRAAVGVLGAGVAHEINNPLGFVMANVRSLGEYLQELGQIVGDHPAGREILEDAPQLLDETDRGLQRIRSIVHDLLHFSVRGQTEEPSGTVRFPEVVDQAIRLAGHELRKRARLEIEDRGSPELRGHARQLGDVVLDLLRNAVDAVAKMPPERQRVVVRSYAAGGQAILEVEDSGTGISAAVLPRIFDPFFTTKANRQGTGLGLSVASEIVRRHGGTINVWSREGQGTLVRVELPAAG